MERREGSMVASSTESKGKLPIVGIMGIIVMLVVFLLIRLVWQQGGRPWAKIPGADFVAVVILVVALVAAYYIHKKMK
jgi:uncharacterized BrkB/YihY/UPF0761 family membrane protein